MGKKDLSVVVVFIASAGFVALGGEMDPNQYDYTMPARAGLFAGTVSGLAEAHQILGNGLDDPHLAGDRRELVFLHALSSVGMVIFDRNDAAVSTSIVEILEPFDIMVTGSTFFPKDRYDLDRMRVRFPVDSNDPNDCYGLPSGADPDTTVAAVKEVVIPEIDTIIAQLDSIQDVPTPFAMILTPTETGLASDVEVDGGDVLALKAVLLTIRAVLDGAVNPACDLTIDFADPLFEGLGCGELPAGTTVNTVLDAYPTLLRLLPEAGGDKLAQAKANLLAVLNGTMQALDYIAGESDDQRDDLLQIDENSPAYLTVRGDLEEFRNSLLEGQPATYTIGSQESFVLTRAGAPVGELELTYEVPSLTGWGSLVLSEPDIAPAARWEIDSFEIDGNYFEAGAEAWEPDYCWAWLEGTISREGDQITDLTISHWAWPDGYDHSTGLHAQRTRSKVTNVEFDPNPLFAGSVSPRDMMPRFDANDTPIAGTVGHELGDDPTLAGMIPGMTQEDWIGTKYAVYGIPDSNVLPYNQYFWHHIDQHLDVVVKLGESAGQTADFPGDYPLYVVATQSKTLIDSAYGLGEDYLDANDIVSVANVSAFTELWTADLLPYHAITGPPDGLCVAVGEVGLLGQFTGFVFIDNPGTWTGLTVVTEGKAVVGVYRLWSSTYGRHFYTIDDGERDTFLQDSAGGWIYEGIVYFAFSDDSEPDVRPVHRFHSASLNTYFYTISESERDMLVQNYPHVWTYDGVAFYAFPASQQPPDAIPVYRFWSNTLRTHFYTTNEDEKDTLIQEHATLWAYEGIAWYVYR